VEDPVVVEDPHRPAECPVRLEEVRRCAAGAAACAVKILITRGVGQRGYAPPDRIQPTRVVLRSPMPEIPAERVEHGVRVRMCSLRLGWQPALAGIKHLNRLENVLARAEWNDSSIAEGLLLDGAGSIIGGTMSNLFIVEGGHLVTPDVSRCGVAGVTRERIMAAAKEHEVRCDVAEIRLDRLLAAQEVMLVNSLIGVWQVRQLDDSTWAPGPVAATVRQWLDEHEV